MTEACAARHDSQQRFPASMSSTGQPPPHSGQSIVSRVIA